MFKIICRCGKSSKVFKFNIGPFFMNDCCIAAGFDDFGIKKGEAKKESKKVVEKEEIPELVEEIKEEEVEETKSTEAKVKDKSSKKKRRH